NVQRTLSILNSRLIPDENRTDFRIMRGSNRRFDEEKCPGNTYWLFVSFKMRPTACQKLSAV
ncbi:hypothetical protein NZA98_12585, partial [Escherichia coli]|nr:hypothetical protein [Escherichia coli]